MKILTTSNYKLQKSLKFGYLTAGLTLAPHSRSGYNVCKNATDGCINACNLWFAGRTVMQPVRDAMIGRTKMFFENSRAFERLLVKEIEAVERKAKRSGVGVAIRLNTASDLPWERLMPEIFRRFKKVDFYDYTKVRSRVEAFASGDLPPNYELTYSLNEKSDVGFVKSAIMAGVNIAVVTNIKYNKRTGYMEPVPEFFDFGGFETATQNADTHDLRLRKFDGKGRALILRFKGSKKSMVEGIEKGFVKCLR